MKQLKVGDEFSLYGYGPKCKVTKVTSKEISFETFSKRGKIPITGNIPLEMLGDHIHQVSTGRWMYDKVKRKVKWFLSSI